ncbi:hypothetical protein NP233_g7319 [Leucocoprinus birnbaumii]|uniref:ATP-dependent DNA helicase n=1 Tax=Leucocoprinus birnbaumii TaxID=56174 RepID=A0AAD5VPK4_9AGAR|nr:hypothetical protein NP233_g7319 [Leucocoprinus birnbaumii]
MSANKFIRYPSVASAPSLLQGSYSIGWHDDYPMDYLVRNSLEHTPSVLSAVGNIAVLACRLAPLGDFNRGSTQLSKAEYTVAISRPESGPDADEWDAAAQCILSLQQKAWAHNTPFQSFKRLCSGHQLPMYYPPFMSQSMNMLLFQRPLFKSLDYEGQNVNLFPLQADPSPRIVLFHSRPQLLNSRSRAAMLVFHDGEPVEPALRCLTKADIENAFPDRAILRSSDRRTRSTLLLAVSQCPATVQDVIRASARRKAERIRQGVTTAATVLNEPGSPAVNYPYMEPPTEETVKSCERQFLLRTGNNSVKTDVCCCCARRSFNTDLTHYRLINVPNRDLLRPQNPHNAHVLFLGALFHRPAIKPGDSGLICIDCLRYLKRNKIPPLSLANDVFLGEVPFELRLLSLAEKILIAKYYPAAYVIKLYPRDPRARAWDHRLFTNGLKGNVASYPLNPRDVAAYIAPSVLPPSPHILSSTICVTFIGPNGRPERFFPDTVYVRRNRVRDALVWLKANNPLYHDIIISEENLSQLPENGVPDDVRYGAHLSNDMSLLGREQDTYVPDDQNPDSFAVPGVEDLTDSEIDEPVGHIEPLVVPLQPSSAIDATGSHLTERAVSSSALANTASTSEHLNVHRGSTFINEYPRLNPESGERSSGTPEDANHLLGTFPWLFPYGLGGFEVERRVNVTYERHAQWALMYDDGRFQRDHYFSPLVFGVIRKRQVARAASIEMSRTDYSRNLNIIAQLTPEDFTLASAEEARFESFSNPAMRALRQSMTTASGKVVYTDASIKQVRSVVWGTVVECGPPTIWFTLNPSDLHNPVAQVFVGQDIDLDDFNSAFGPNSTERAINVAQDPAGAALFCHHLFKAVLECLFGIVGAKGSAPPTRRPGVLGTVEAYVGTIEAQGRGTLHMHCLLWLSNTPLPSTFDALLSEELFRERVVRYVGSVMHADIDGLDTAGILAMPTVHDVSFSRPIDPEDDDYDKLRKLREKNLARSLQLHTCSTHACLQKKNGRLACKRGVPFDCAEQDWVASDGRLGPKRHCSRLNNWNPSTLVAAGCNNDLKVITHGPETKDATFYMSDYQSKGSQNTSYNISALLGERIRYHLREEQDCADIGASAKRLLTRCLNSLNRLQEFGGPQIASVLLDLPDRYISHHHVSIFMDAMRSALKLQFPDLNFWVPSQSCNKVIFIDRDVELRDQLRDYQYRGDALGDYSFYQFLINTYEGDPLPDNFQPSARGRNVHERIPYRAGVHPRKCRLVRKPGHETHPNFIGKWFPRNNRPEEAEEHAAMMLMLFRPWRLLTDLKPPFATFSDQYQAFLETASDAVRRKIDNIQYYHQGMDRRSVRHSDAVVTLSEDQEARQRREEAQECGGPQPRVVTEASLEFAQRERRNAKLISFGEKAIEIGRRQGIFRVLADPDVSLLSRSGCISQELLARLRSWNARLQTITFETASQSDVSSSSLAPPPHLSVDVAPWNAQPVLNPHLQVIHVPRRQASSRPSLRALRADQRLVHDIVESQLLKHLNKEPTEQLLMLCLGEGGTGKTKIIREITATYREHGHPEWLSRTATSGVAATLIEGETLHGWLGFGSVLPAGNQWMSKASASTESKRSRKILNRRLLIIDECSMLTSRLLCLTSQLTDYVRRRGGSGNDTSSQPFGGLDVILFGDFHQFPPVPRSGMPLYEPSKKEQDMLGHQIYLQFTTVVILKEQMRLQDPRWLAFLKRLRVGGCNTADMGLLRRLTLTNPECVQPDYSNGPWANPVLVTSRHAVKDAWNKEALIKHCSQTNQIWYICPAFDTVKNRRPTLEEQEIIIKGLSDDFPLEEEIQIAVGAQVLVEMNIATEAGLANGTRGTVMEIVLDEHEGQLSIAGDGSCRLTYPPALIWFKPENPCVHVFDLSKPGLLPVTPTSQRFSIAVQGQDNVAGKRTQLPLVLAYAFTDYKSQGQTLEAVLVDLAHPPDRGVRLTPISAYVALSRVKDSHFLRILRDFDESLFTTPPPSRLLEEDRRLAKLDQESRARFSASSDMLDKYTPKSGFLGRYPVNMHPFDWRLNYPMDFVIERGAGNTPATLTVLGILKSDLGRLGPLGDFEDECLVLGKSQYTVVLQSPRTFPLRDSWLTSMDILYNLHGKIRTGSSSWTLNIPGGGGSSPSQIPFRLHAPLGPFTAANMNFTRPVFTVCDAKNRVFGSLAHSPAIDITSSPLSDATNEKIMQLEGNGLIWTDVDVRASDGSNILSWDYPTILDGSLVAVDFELGHCSVFGRDDFVALFKTINVEIPNAGASTPSDDDDSMPDLVSV